MPDTVTTRRPDPDPTVLTTQQLDKGIAALREVLEARLAGMKQLIKITRADMESLPARCHFEVGALQALHEEKIKGLQTQIQERDVQTDKASRDVKSAVDAAFAAAKEAVGEQNKSNALSITKSEAAFTKQMDGIVTLITTSTSAVDGKINDIKDRLTTIESHSKGIGDGWAIIAGAIMVLIAVVTVGIAIIKM